MASKYDDALIGRAILARAIVHLKEFTRIPFVECDKPNGQQGDHISIWKEAMTLGREEASDALQELADCPYCSAVIASWQARKILKAKLGGISRGLTLSGQALRRKRYPAPEIEVSAVPVTVIDPDFDIPF